MTAVADTRTGDSGRPPTAGEHRRHIRPRVRTRESLTFLTEVGNALASSLDYEATLQRVAELTVPRLACYCELDLVENGSVRRVALAHADRTQQAALSRTRVFPEQVDGGPLAEVLDTGRSLLVTSPDEVAIGDSDTDERMIDLLRTTNATSLLLIPMSARGRRLGVLLLASSRTDRLYGPHDLALAEELARIAGLAIDNARLYSEAHRAIAARNEILRIVSHDLRSPIGVMAMAAALLLETTTAEGGERSNGHLLRMIGRASRQATRLIEDLLDFARIDTGRLAVDLRLEELPPLIVEAVEIYGPSARERGIDLAYLLGGPLPLVRVDRVRVIQVLGNLLTNALKYTPPGGRIEVSAAVCGNEVCCSVADTGPGIPSDQLQQVFDRFWQVSPGERGGLGLGLAIVRGIAEAHGGRVWVESEPGKGARFVVAFPVPEGLGPTETKMIPDRVAKK